MIAVSARAGSPLWIPDDVVGHCCATIWHSKGYDKGNAVMANRVAEAMWRWSDGGRLPIVCDASSCSLGLTSEIIDYLTPQNRERHAKLTIFDVYRLGARPPVAEAPRPAEGRRGGATPELFGQSPQADRQAACARRRPCRHGGDAGGRRLLRVRRRPRSAPHRIDALGDC